MADVITPPKVSCDNCGAVEEKEHRLGSWERPKLWGSLHIEGGRTDGYGIKGKLAFTDLCKECAVAALDAAAVELKKRRREA